MGAACYMPCMVTSTKIFIENTQRERVMGAHLLRMTVVNYIPRERVEKHSLNIFCLVHTGKVFIKSTFTKNGCCLLYRESAKRAHSLKSNVMEYSFRVLTIGLGFDYHSYPCVPL